LVGIAALRLPHHWCIGYKAAGGELLQDELVCICDAARRVHVFDAHQPLAAVGTRV
jgi:hypothetical protein